MTRALVRLVPLALLAAAAAGCGDNVNKAPEGAGTIDYAQASKDKMASMYGTPKAEKAKSTNAADMMRSMYNR
jgi:hypothetical protein